MYMYLPVLLAIRYGSGVFLYSVFLRNKPVIRFILFTKLNELDSAPIDDILYVSMLLRNIQRQGNIATRSTCGHLPCY